MVLPSGTGLWACPESTIPPKGEPCPNNTRPPCSGNTAHPGGPGCPAPSGPGPKPPKRAAGLDRDALVLLQGQLRDRLAQGPAVPGI